MKYENIEKRAKVLTENSTKCKCSHTIPIPIFVDKVVCNWCGNTVYRTPEIEFKYKLKKELNKKKYGEINE